MAVAEELGDGVFSPVPIGRVRAGARCSRSGPCSIPARIPARSGSSPRPATARPWRCTAPSSSASSTACPTARRGWPRTTTSRPRRGTSPCTTVTWPASTTTTARSSPASFLAGVGSGPRRRRLARQARQGRGDGRHRRRLPARRPRRPARARDLHGRGARADPDQSVGAAFIGRVVRHWPSRSWRAAATAGAVGTRPISPTPLMPYGDCGCGHLDELDLDLGDVLGPQDAELAQRRERREAGLRIGREVLGQRVAEAHVHAALDLAGAQLRVDRLADVVDGDDPLDLAGRRGRARPSGRRSRTPSGSSGSGWPGRRASTSSRRCARRGGRRRARQSAASAASHARCTAPAAISVPRDPVVWPNPSWRVVSTMTSMRAGSMPSSWAATCRATVCTPWPISVHPWRTSTRPSALRKRTTAPDTSRNPLPSPQFFRPEAEPDRLAGGDRRVVRPA